MLGWHSYSRSWGGDSEAPLPLPSFTNTILLDDNSPEDHATGEYVVTSNTGSYIVFAILGAFPVPTAVIALGLVKNSMGWRPAYGGLYGSNDGEAWASIDMTQSSPGDGYGIIVDGIQTLPDNSGWGWSTSEVYRYFQYIEVGEPSIPPYPTLGVFGFSDFRLYTFDKIIPTSGLVYGCTDPNATNYNPLATADDGSCVYKQRLGHRTPYVPGPACATTFHAVPTGKTLWTPGPTCQD